MNLRRPAFLHGELPEGPVHEQVQEEIRKKEERKEHRQAEPELPQVFQMNEEDEKEERRQLEREDELMWRWRMGRDLQDAHLHLRAQREENERLKEQLKRALEREFHTPQEDGPRGQQGLPKEDGPRGQQGSSKEEGPRGQQGSSKEDGPRGQQGSSKEDGPRGQQAHGGAGGGINEKQMEVMLLMVESMKELKKQISEEGSRSLLYPWDGWQKDVLSHGGVNI